MNKYIIKNCPAYNINTNHCTNEIIADCKDITDCLLKRIVALCNAYDDSWGLSEEILDVLEIEKVDE